MSMKTMNAVLGSTPEHYKKLGLKKGQIEKWEDGMRTDGSEGTYEWWYFDAHLNDGSKLVIVFFTKPYIESNKPLTPFVTFNLDLSDGRTIKKIYQTSEQDFFASNDQCEVRIGPNIFKGDLNTYQIHIEIEDVLADITIKGAVPSWRPETGHWFYGNGEEKYFAWLPSVPYGIVEADIKIDNTIQHYTGTGYHDHNWGNTPMMELMNNWYWARAQIGGYTVIASFITAEQKYGYEAFPIFMLAKENEIIVDNERNVRFTACNKYVDPVTGKPVANTTVYDYKDDIHHYTITFEREKNLVVQKFIDELTGKIKEAAIQSGFDGAYLRFIGDVQLERFEGAEVVEILNEKAIWDLMYFGKVRQ